MNDSTVRGSRLSIVPKNDETGRATCTEPSINMLFQLGIGKLLERRLKKVYNIDLKDQPFKNQRLAQLGSMSDTFGTIDLKSASDSISLELLNNICPSDMVRFLTVYRSPEVNIPGLGFITLPIISTMGNGYTFPLQTIIFASIVHAVYDLLGIRLQRHGAYNFGVFGDDIIVTKRAYPVVVKTLEMYGFVVNKDKSFYEGPFRESCGADYYLGSLVRGVYLKRFDTMQDVYVAINTLNLWSSRTGIYLPSTTRYLLARCKWLPVPRWESDDAGIKVPYKMVVGTLRIDRFVQSPLYRYFSIIPKSVKISGNIENPDGALVALLSGNIRNERIVRRSPRRYYKLKWNCAPGWDNPVDPSTNDGVLGQQWNTAVYFNLNG